jgi:HEAT repeat protein
VGKEVVDADAVPMLTFPLDDADTRVRWHAVRNLGYLGPPAAGAVPDMVRLLDDKCVEARFCTAIALRNMGPTARPALPRLKELRRDGTTFAGYGTFGNLVIYVIARIESDP